MRDDELDVDPHQPEMPDTRCVVPSKKRCKPVELHGLVNRPSRSGREKPGDWNREVGCALERVVLCVEDGMRPLTARQFREGKPNVVSKHPERVQQISPTGEQRAPAPSPDQPRNVHHAIQHEQVRAQPMQAQSQPQHARPEAHVVVKPVGWTAVVMQSRYMCTYPDSNIRRYIEVSRSRIWLVSIDRRCPV